MTRAGMAGIAFAAVLALSLVAFVAVRLAPERDATPSTAFSSTFTEPAEAHPAPDDHRGFLYGRITAVDGTVYEGRLRWGGVEEAFWSDAFNGTKQENPWAAHVPPERLREPRSPVRVLGLEIARGDRQIDLRRPFMARFGDLVRIEARDRTIRVTLKSGTGFDLDRLSADDLADGLRVWDDERGVVDLHERRIRTIELLPTLPLEALPYRLHGTVRTTRGDFTGFVQWNRWASVGSDELLGRTPDGKLGLRFDRIRAIERRSDDGCRVTLLDGRELDLAGTRDVGRGHRGVHVDDPRYGRVLVFWSAFERVDFDAGDSGPAYDDYPPGHPLTGSVTTRNGVRLSGRLVYDLDESETVETLDAPSGGVHYTIPFGLIASIVPAGRDERDAERARLTLHGGEVLWLEPAGDLGEENAGVLVFVDGDSRAEHVSWTDVERVDLDRPAAMYPPLGGR